MDKNPNATARPDQATNRIDVCPVQVKDAITSPAAFSGFAASSLQHNASLEV